MFTLTEKVLSSGFKLDVIDIKSIDGELELGLNRHLVSICEGNSESELRLIKLRLKNFLSEKSLNTKMGAIAELIIHLYLMNKGYKQEFLFFNLEEGSIKKGFDGFFSKSSETYIMESKSGSVLSESADHKSKLKIAYSDLDGYVSGKSKKSTNNPWKNAYNHASHIDVGTKDSIRKKIKELQDMFDLGQFSKIGDFNIIPCSTIYLDGAWDSSLSDDVLSNSNFILDFDGKTVKAICVTKSSMNIFMNYLEK
ncbi:hypothetical protein [Ferrimonas sp.]|uniref:hypothetical protein n=1 Tax=Ferrimonas sp. TaxID=2080861 RepID=UPI003A90BE6D